MLINMENITAQIRKLRIEKGYTVEEFSKKIGFSSQTGYHKIESGITDLKIKHLYRIAEVLEVTPEELLGLDAPQQQTEDGNLLKEYIRRLKTDLSAVTFQYRNLYGSYQFLDEVLSKLEKENPEAYKSLQEVMTGTKEKRINQNLKTIESTEFSENQEKEDYIKSEKEMGEQWKKLSPKETTSEVLRHHTFLRDMFDQIVRTYLDDKENTENNSVWKKPHSY